MSARRSETESGNSSICRSDILDKTQIRLTLSCQPIRSRGSRSVPIAFRENRPTTCCRHQAEARGEEQVGRGFWNGDEGREREHAGGGELRGVPDPALRGVGQADARETAGGRREA